MASIKLKYRPSAIEGREGSLYYQVICDSTIRKLSTSYKLLPEEWDSENEEVLCNPLSCRANYVEAVRQSTSHEMHRFRTLAQDLLTAYLKNADPALFEQLLADQRAWLKFADSFSTAVYTGFGSGGSMYRSMGMDAKMSLWAQRIKYLDTVLGYVSEVHGAPEK